MRPTDLDNLEFPRLLEAVAGYAVSESGREACLALRPSTSAAAVRDELARVEQLAAVTEEEPAPLGAFPDVRAHLALSATPGAKLSGRELKEVAAMLATVRRMRGYLRARAAGRPLLLRYLGALHALPDLDRLLSDALDEEGELRDGASPTLRALRRELRELRADIERRLARLFRQGQASSAIAEEYVTLRNGRYVVPVRARAASELPGIVQDRSASGETLFVEPLFAVEANNRLLIAAREEAEEEARILAELTSAVGANREALGEAFAALTEIDTLLARVAFAARHRAGCPKMGEASVRLGNARHPLLELTGREVTPIDIVLGEGTHLLVVSGPNTGGKSVALKTLGLSVLMAQSGIPILADADSHLPVFDAVWTDIGDPQNVAGDLSTFSGHVRNLIEILSGATDGSLVLLDEPGTGTDPEDGAALARVLLRELVERRCRVLATTHFQSVKAFALALPGAEVAAVDFDPETFAPRYRLVYRNIAPSLGLEIARRLGFPPKLLEAAEAERSALGAELVAAARALDEERRLYEQRARELADERATLAETRAEEQRLLDELREKRGRRWSEELAEARRFAAELRHEGERMLAEARRQPAKLGRRLRDLGDAQRARISRMESAVVGERAAPEGPAPRVGDEVQVAGSALRGRLESIMGARARLVRGGIRFEVPLAQLRRVATEATERSAGPRRAPEVVVEADEPATPRSAALTLPEINLIGERVRDALDRLEAFLDQAVLEDASAVRIVHGTGSGALRDAVREYLSGSPYVTRFEQADHRSGGAGATIAYLR